ncbi:MAG TPA: tetratricopeptide repeat protein, partial [Pyrinomonadaceae bacterium]|nr:tetratricopeptide repeat protein [Pyrinomonadaceae bacterium]
AVTSRIARDYAVTKFDEYVQSSNFDRDTASSGRLTDSQLEEARYMADVNIGDQLRRRPFPLIGRNVLYFFSFESIFISALISLSLFFVPALLILTRLSGAAAYTSTNMRSNYMPLATCTTMAWVAAHLPFAVAGIAMIGQPVDGAVFLLMWLISGLLFGVLTIFGARTVLGINYLPAAVIVILSLLAFPLGMYVFRFVSPHLFSPFLIIMVVLYFGGFLSSEARGFGNAFRQRQNFKRFLHNSTVNPKDADAHVQLGMIYLQRRQEAKALEHLNKAIAIDPDEIDANYELGKLARSKGDLQAALDHFGVVLEQNDKHSLSEIWREIGATYLAANMLTEARDALEKFAERRSADVEGLYYLGKVLKAQGENARAADVFSEAIQSAKASPDYHRNRTKHWSKLAQKEL